MGQDMTVASSGDSNAANFNSDLDILDNFIINGWQESSGLTFLGNDENKTSANYSPTYSDNDSDSGICSSSSSSASPKLIEAMSNSNSCFEDTLINANVINNNEANGLTQDLDTNYTEVLLDNIESMLKSMDDKSDKPVKQAAKPLIKKESNETQVTTSTFKKISPKVITPKTNSTGPRLENAYQVFAIPSNGGALNTSQAKLNASNGLDLFQLLNAKIVPAHKRENEQATQMPVIIQQQPVFTQLQPIMITTTAPAGTNINPILIDDSSAKKPRLSVASPNCAKESPKAKKLKNESNATPVQSATLILSPLMTNLTGSPTESINPAENLKNLDVGPCFSSNLVLKNH